MERKFKILLTKKFVKQLSKIDPLHRAYIANWVKTNLEDCADPRRHGKALVGDRAGAWRYRVGDYRIIAEILDDQIVIHLMEVGHRKEVYKN